MQSLILTLFVLNLILTLFVLSLILTLFVLNSQEALLTATGYYEGKTMIQACGKFIVLEKMLKELRKQEHRVLIFSQVGA